MVKPEQSLTRAEASLTPPIRLEIEPSYRDWLSAAKAHERHTGFRLIVRIASACVVLGLLWRFTVGDGGRSRPVEQFTLALGSLAALVFLLSASRLHLWQSWRDLQRSSAARARVTAECSDDG